MFRLLQIYNFRGLPPPCGKYTTELPHFHCSDEKFENKEAVYSKWFQCFNANVNCLVYKIVCEQIYKKQHQMNIRINIK